MEKNLSTASTATAGRSPGRTTETLAHRVREVLLAFGGEAHRKMVIEQVARGLGHDVRHIPEELQAAVILSFEEAWRDEQRRQSLGFHLPFGEGSHRWGVRAEPVLH